MTSIVALVVVVLSALHLVSLTRALLQQSRHRGELIALTIYHRAQNVVVSPDTGYQDLRRDPGVRAALESALYSENVAYAAIVDPVGSIVAHSDPSRVGERLPGGDDLGCSPRRAASRSCAPSIKPTACSSGASRCCSATRRSRTFASGQSTLLIRETLTEALKPAALAAAAALWSLSSSPFCWRRSSSGRFT